MLGCRPLVLLALMLAAGLRAFGGLEAIPEKEALSPPSRSRLAGLAEAGAQGDWAGVDAVAFEAANLAYGKDRLNAAEGWFYLHRWAELFGESEAQFVVGWMTAVDQTKVGHANMARTYATTDRRLGTYLAPELRRWLLENAAFSDEFFSLLSSVDYVPQVFALLNEMHEWDPDRFKEYASLALAIAVVYDVPPPPDWPHAQVSATALPRRWPRASEAFAWWVREDRAGHTYQRLSRLGADELKFVVDAAAPFAELEWAQDVVSYPLAELPQAYTMIRYRMDRAQGQQLVWPGRTYLLSDILRDGGICVDQAYFAVEAGKARGVPTLLFLGSGLDGRHAWFGYLDGEKKWQLDAGRYAEQRFVTGMAYDPQTWRELSDHEIRFLAERFRSLPTYRQSRIHEAFASERLQQRHAAEAAASARKAVNYERRNLAAWQTLLAAQEAEQSGAAVLEATLREAALAFQRYPDLEVIFSNRLTASLRARGEASLASFEEQRLARKYQEERPDLSIQQAVGTLKRSFDTQPQAGQVATYNAIVDNFGRGAGIEFFDEIVVVFSEHLLLLGDRPGALRAVEYARGALKIEPGQQLDQEMAKLVARLRK